jgi:hypothetical protein
MHIKEIEWLSQNLNKVATKDMDFVISLTGQFKKKGVLSDKQWPWVKKIYDRMQEPELPLPPPKMLEVGDMKGVQALFAKASEKIKFPTVVLMTQSGVEIRLSIAGQKAKNPGTVNVVNVHTKEWYGRIHMDGNWEVSKRVTPPKDLWVLLVGFANKPAEVAASFGHLTGRCCFCNSGLTTDKSLSVGYGPVCAKKWGLAWGTAETVKTMKLELKEVA